MKYVVVGTAGHIDHGKTSLIKALTGIDTDRLPEEKQRGITIDIGFAHWKLSEKVTISFIDVPGHEKLVKNMIAGACGIDMVLLVVAADEGVMPQTVEHANICKILGIEKGVVAVTKIDLVEKDILPLVEEEIVNFLQRWQILPDAPVTFVSSKTGEGIEELRKKLEEVALSIPERKKKKTFRMPIDRVFTIKGFGTVVTGTVFSGKVSVGDEIELLPQKKKIKVRNIQVRGETRETAYTGERAALNLAGVEKEEIERGDNVATAESFPVTDTIDAKVYLLPNSVKLKDLSPIRVHIATKSVVGKIKLLEKEILLPEEEEYVRIHLQEPIVAASSDVIVLRSYSPVTTIGGGYVLDPFPEKIRIKRSVVLERLKELDEKDEKGRIELFIKWKPQGVEKQVLKYKLQDPETLDEIIEQLEKENAILKLGDILFHRETISTLERRLKEIVKDYLKKNPLKKGMPVAELSHRVRINKDILTNLIKNMKSVEIKEDRVIIPGRQEQLDEKTKKIIVQVEKEFIKAGFSPPPVEEVFSRLNLSNTEKQHIFRYLIENKILVRISREIVTHKKIVEKMIELVKKHFERKPELTVSEFKNMLNISRKYAIPYLEYMDRVGVTKRVGNVRRRR